jgi:inorganic pyrophosphatase
MYTEKTDYRNIIGKTVKGTVDRPLGSVHPRFTDMIYPINYGYVDGVFAGDGMEQDVYLFGTDKPLKTFEGKVIAVWRRFDDVEDKWIVSLDGLDFSDEKIIEDISFQEQFYNGKLYRN